MQFIPLAMIRAVVVLPVPRIPVMTKGLRDPIGGKGVAQRAHHRVLADKIGKGFWPVFAGQHLIGGWGRFAHAGSRLYSYPIR